MKRLTRLMKALSDQNRLKVIKMLQKRRMCVCELQAALGIAQPTVSSHLKVLEAAGIVESSKEGQWVNYSLVENGPDYGRAILENVKALLEDHREIAVLLAGLDSINRENLCSAKPHR